MSGQKPNACGPASLAIALHNLGTPVLPEELEHTMNFNPDEGVEFHQMIDAARQYGLDVHTTRGVGLKELKQLKDMGGEVILCWVAGSNPKEDGHFSVLYDYDEENKLVVLNDTEAGGSIRVYNQRIFESKWFDLDDEREKLPKWEMIITKPRG